MNKLIITIAIGNKYYAEMAVVLASSIKHKSEIPILVITDDCFDNLSPRAKELFSKVIKSETILERGDMSVLEYVCRLKTLLYAGLEKEIPVFTEVMFLDADVIINPGRSADELFDKMNNKFFACWCNGSISLSDGRYLGSPNMRYPSWIVADEAARFFAREKMNVDQMPVLNTSIIYWKQGHEAASLIFNWAAKIYCDTTINTMLWNGVRPDEVAFNLASTVFFDGLAKGFPNSITGSSPYVTPFKPIFLLFNGGTWDEQYVLNHYPATALIGNEVMSKGLIDFYTKNANYYLKLQGLGMQFKYKHKRSGKLSSEKIVLGRAGGFGRISDGGVINPSIWRTNDGYEGTLRVDENFDGYDGRKETAVCRHVWVTYDKEFNLLNSTTIHSDVKQLTEDFRLFNIGVTTFASFATWDGSKWQQGIGLLSHPYDKIIRLHQFKTAKDEKNWGFLSRDYGHYNFKFIYKVVPWTVREYYQQSNHLQELQWIKPEKELHWPGESKHMISISTLPVEYDKNHLIMWVHQRKDNGWQYEHTALLIDKETLLPTHFIPHHCLDDSNMDTVLYISSCIVEDNRILLFGGEGGTTQQPYAPTAYASVRIIDRNDFDALIKKHRL